MDSLRLKKFVAGVSAVALTLTQVGTVFAAYSDVPSGAWYAEAVEAFLDAGYLDASQPRFRGSDPANRAEFVKLVVELNGGVLSTPPAVATFDDVKPGAWYYAIFEEANKEAWVRGDGNCAGSHPCYARPGANINRAEAAALIVRAFGLEGTGDAPTFVDNPSGQWYTEVIQTAADSCILQGDDSTSRVRPGDNMNRAEMVVMLHRVDQNMTYGVDCGTEPTEEAGITDATSTDATTVEVEFNVSVDEDAAMDVSHYTVTGPEGEVAVTGAELGDNDVVTLTLEKAVTAGEQYTVSVEDMMSADGDTFSDSGTFSGYSPVPLGNGTLEVTVAASNPMGDAVPRGAVGVAMVSMDMTASCDDAVVITEITILHEGFGDEADIDGVYAAIDGARVSRKRTIDSEDQTADLRFSSPLTIPACQSKTIDVVADFNSTAAISAEHNIAVELPSDVKSNAQAVEGNFPMRGNTFRVAAVTSGRVTVTYRSVSPTEVEVGNKAVVVGKFELSTNSVEDQTFYSMTFEQNGSVSDADIANIALRRSDGTVLTNVAPSTVGDFVTLVFDPPFTLLEGDKVTLEVITDVIGGAADTIIMHFEETSDIFAVGSLYGYGVNGQLYGSQVSIAASPAASTITIDAGEFTIEVDGPVQQKYTRDTNDAVLAKILMTTGGESVDIKDLFVAIQAQTSTGGGLQNLVGTAYDNVAEVLEDFELRNTKTGQTVSAVRLTGATELGTGTTSTATFNIYRFDDFVVNGKETWEARVDFIDNGAGVHPTSGDRFRIHICGQPTSSTTGCTFGGLVTSATTWNMKIEGLSTGDNVTDVRPGGTITGNFHRIANPELTLSVRSLGSSDTAVKNSKNIQVFRFEARAGEAEDILLTKLIFNSESGSLQNGQNYTLWVDTDGDSTVDTILESGIASQSSAVTFDELAGGGYVIPAEDTVMFEVHADIAASLTNNDLLIKFSTGTTTTFVEAEEVDDGSNLSNIRRNSTCLDSAGASATSCDIIVTTVRSKLWLLADQGDLFVQKDSTPTRSRQLLGGALADPILRLEFRAQNEPVEVTDLQFSSSGSNAASVDRLELYKEDATTPFATATVGGCGNDDVLTTNGPNGGAIIQTFCANMENRQFVVPEGERQDVIIRPRVKSDVEGGTVNQVVQLWLTGQRVSDNTTGSGAVRARGAESSNNLSASDGDATAEGEVFIGRDSAASTNLDIVGSVNHVVMAKIVSITNANPDADNTNVPTSTTPFGQFKFTAASNTNSLNGLNKATLSGIIFTVNATNVILDRQAFRLYNKNDSSNKLQNNSATSGGKCVARDTTGSSLGNANSASGSFLVDCNGLAVAGSWSTGQAGDTILDSGETLTLVLEGSVTNPKVSSSSTSTLQASLQSFTTLTTTTYGASVSHLEWTDNDTSAQNFFWVEYPETEVKSTSYKS